MKTAFGSVFPPRFHDAGATVAVTAAAVLRLATLYAVFALLLHSYCRRCCGFRAAVEEEKMAKTPGESKIPVLHTTNQQLRSRFSSISSKVRSHLDASYRTSSPSVLFGLFSGGGGVDSAKSPQPAAVRPSSLFKSSADCRDATGTTEIRDALVVEPTRRECSVTGGFPEQQQLRRPNAIVGDRTAESELAGGYDLAATVDFCGGGGSWDKTESPFECNDSLGILTPEQMREFRGDDEEVDCEDVPGLFFKTLPLLMTDCISDGDVTMNDLEAISMPKDDDLESPALSSDPSNRTVSEHDSASAAAAYPKRSSTVSFGNVFYDNFTAADRTPSLEDLPMDDMSSRTGCCTTEEDRVPLTTTTACTTVAAVVVTSITSVGSLDTGYQGDGETSRPTSRGGGHKRPQPTAADPMTDSDFFTESEAEDHCHRRARVIDGTLYSGGSDIPETRPDLHCENRGSSGIVEEMDSSGVFSSDFDKIFEEPPPAIAPLPPPPVDCEAIVSSTTSPSSVNSQVRSSADASPPSFRSDRDVLETSEDASSPASKRCKRPAAVKPKTLDVPRRAGDDQQQQQENRAPRTRKPAGRWDAVMNKIEKSKTDQKSRTNRLKDVKSKINSMVCNPLLLPPPPPYANHRLKESPTNSEPLPVRPRRDNCCTPLKAKSRRTRARGGSESNLPVSDMQTGCSSPRPRCSVLKSSRNSSRDSSFSDLSGETNTTLKQAISHPSLACNKNGRGPRVSPSSVNVVTPTVRRPAPAGTTAPPSKGSPQNRRINLDHNNLTATTKPDGNLQKTPSQAVVTKTTAVSGAAQAARVKVAKKDATVDPHHHRQHHHHQQPHRDAQLLHRAENQLRHVTKGFDAMSVLLRYLVDDMDALSTTKLKQQLDANHNDLVSTKRLLDESQAKCVQYCEEVDRLRNENDTYRIDLEGKEKRVVEIALSKEKEIRELEDEHRERVAGLRARFDDELSALKNASEEEKMKLILSHDQRVVELQLASKAEAHRAEKSAAEKQTEFARKVSELENERDRLESEVDALKEENRRLFEDKKLQNTSLGYQKLCDETESLRTVLELKSAEMQELRKQNERLQREADELPTILQKYEAAQSRVEDLNVQLQRKSEIEMQLSMEKDKMAREIDLEKQKKKRLSCHNEELQWKLKKSTEVANHLAVTTKRLSQTPQDLAAMREAQNNYQKLCRDSSNSDNSNGSSSSGSGDDDACGQQLAADDGAAPPARILGVMKKNDSLSYVFEVEEEPSAIATRLVRRASSLRSVSAKHRNETCTSSVAAVAAKKRSRASSQSSAAESAEPSALARNLDEMFATAGSDTYNGGGGGSSDCCSSEDSSSSNSSSPKHTVYDQQQNVIDQVPRGPAVYDQQQNVIDQVPRGPAVYDQQQNVIDQVPRGHAVYDQ